MFFLQVFTCLFCGFLMVGALESVHAQQPEINQVLSAVKSFTADGRLLSMRVEIQTEDFVDGKWVPSAPSQAANVTLDPVFTGRFRIEYDPVCYAWINGAAPFIGEHKIVAYDGKAVRMVGLEAGPSNKMSPDLNASIEDLNFDSTARYRYYAGLDFLVPLAKYTSGNFSLYENLTEGDMPSLSSEGDRLIITNKFKSAQTERFELDKSRGYILLKRSWSYKPEGMPPSYSEYLPENFQNIPELGWMPTSGVLNTDSQGKISRATYKFSNFAVSKQDGSTLFKPNVPAGYTFEDKRLKLKFKVGVTGQALIDSIHSTAQGD